MVLHQMRVTPSNKPHEFLSFFLAMCLLFSITASQLHGQGKSSATVSTKKTANLTEAKDTYESVCATCHGLDGRGSERGPDIASKPDVVQKTDAGLLAVLKNGKTAAGMPAFSAFGSVKLTALVAYLRTLQSHGGETSLPGDPSKGKVLFFGKASCSECHMVRGQGGFYGPDLTFYASRMSTDEVRGNIVNPNKDLDPRRGVVNVVLADSTALSGVARNEDNFSLQLQTRDGVFHLLNKSEIRSQTYVGQSAMPSDYGSTLSPGELNDLVSYLLLVSRSANSPKAQSHPGDGDED